MEVEENCTITYLDAALFRSNKRIIFDWHTKKISTNRLINFNSNHPNSQKINTAKNFIERVLKISDVCFHNKNIDNIFKILAQNSFPNNLIRDLVNQSIKRIKDTQINLTNKKEEKFYSVQFIPGLTDNKNIKETMKLNKNNIAYKPNKTLGTIFTKIKARIENQQKNNVVYEIKCKGNKNKECDKIYIGTTKRTVATRIGEHKTDILRRKETTALAQHILNNDHVADFGEVRILSIEKNERKRYIKESLFIQKNIERTMNVKEDTKDINDNYKLAIA